MPPKKAVKAAAAAVNNIIAFGRVKSSLKMGCIGLPNVGKSSLFNLLTNQAVPAENYPFCTIEPNTARCAVPDARYDFLCGLWRPPAAHPAYLHVTDIAGLIRGASDGEGLGNAFLSHIQAVDGLYHVVRAFASDEVLHVEDSVNPVRDLATIQTELCKKDLDILARARAAEEAAARKAGGRGKITPLFDDTAGKIRELLERDRAVRDGVWTAPEIALINDRIRLLTTKPAIYLVNTSLADHARRDSAHLPAIRDWVRAHGGAPADIIPFSVDFEERAAAYGADAAGRAQFLDSHGGGGGAHSSLPAIINRGFARLGLQYYFTAGAKEVRCWVVKAGTLAPQAAGVIHGDFERGFIKAEVVAFEDFRALCAGGTSMVPIKAAGRYRQEGRNYAVQDGDIIHFQFNVTGQKKR